MDRSRDRVLFITGGSIGDTVLTAGLLRRFVECEPEALFTVAAGPVAVSLFLEHAAARRDDRHRQAATRAALARAVAAGGRPPLEKAVIDMRGSGLSYALRAERRFASTAPCANAPARRRCIRRKKRRGRSAPSIRRLRRSFTPPSRGKRAPTNSSARERRSSLSRRRRPGRPRPGPPNASPRPWSSSSARPDRSPADGRC